MHDKRSYASICSVGTSSQGLHSYQDGTGAEWARNANGAPQRQRRFEAIADCLTSVRLFRAHSWRTVHHHLPFKVEPAATNALVLFAPFYMARH
jgi:hypothetical protein